MSVAVLVPSLDRPQRLLGLIENIHATTDNARILFCVSDQASLDIMADVHDAHYVDDSGADDHRYVTRGSAQA